MAEEIYLTQYGLMAERHWRELRPGTVREMEALTLQMEKVQNMTPQQAHDRAREMIRENYILLPPEER